MDKLETLILGTISLKIYLIIQILEILKKKLKKFFYPIRVTNNNDNELH